MGISTSSNINIFNLASVLNLIVVCGGALHARPETITNTITGQTVMFPIEHQGKEEQYIVTFELKSPRLLKFFKWHSSDPGKLYLVQSGYEHRATIENGSVVLNNVQVNDSGVYQMRIDYYGSELKNHDRSTFRIHVFDPVSQPAVKRIIHGQNAPNITLNCIVRNEEAVTIYWEKIFLSGGIKETNAGPILVVGCATEGEQYKYRCIVKNPVSNASSSEVSVNKCNIGNLNGKKNHLMILIPLGMLVGIILIYLCRLCYKSKYCCSGGRRGMQLSTLHQDSSDAAQPEEGSRPETSHSFSPEMLPVPLSNTSFLCQSASSFERVNG
ncbi:SLAM family member 9-like [Rhinoraja longicauda]